LFPALQKLSLYISALFPLDDFIIKSFAELKKLKSLDLSLESRPAGSVYLFKGFLELPRLESFELSIPFIKQEEWRILSAFLAKQKDLEHLSLKITKARNNRARYHAENKGIQGILHNLNGMKRLRILKLKATHWSLESLSEGLKHVTFINQLKELEIEGIDDCMAPIGTIRERVSGLCEFIKRQKGSLQKLTFQSYFLVKVSVLNQIVEAISELKELRELEFYLHDSNYSTPEQMLTNYEIMVPVKNYRNIRQEMRGTGNNRRPKISTMLKDLENLEKLTLRIRTVTGGEEDSRKWFMDVLRMLSGMRNLRCLNFTIPKSASNSKDVNEMKGILMGLENLKTVNELFCHEYGMIEAMNSLSRDLREKNQKQAERCDLMF